jgi:hypothetical protein
MLEDNELSYITDVVPSDIEFVFEETEYSVRNEVGPNEFELMLDDDEFSSFKADVRSEFV